MPTGNSLECLLKKFQSSLHLKITATVKHLTSEWSWISRYRLCPLERPPRAELILKLIIHVNEADQYEPCTAQSMRETALNNMVGSGNIIYHT